MLKRQENVRVVLAEVSGFDLDRRQVVLNHLANGQRGATLDYDTLVVAGGSQYSYFGHEDWRTNAPELKSLAGALEIRNRILSAFEAAEEVRQSGPLVKPPGAGKLGKVAEAIQEQ